MPKAQLLLVEDDSALAELVRWHFEREEFDVQHTGDGEEALLMAKERTPDLVLLDWMLENLSGIEVCRQLRKADNTANVPIIMLTARGEEDDRIRGLEIGADDYVTKPVVPKELAARIRAAMRRVQLQEVTQHSDNPAKGTSSSQVNTVRDIEIRRDLGVVRKGGVEVALTKTEYRLLCEFADHPLMVLSRDQLLERVWGYEYLGDSRIVDAHVRRLRLKIEDHPDDPQIIATARGVGYRLMPS